jgi:hypothetical protein
VVGFWLLKKKTSATMGQKLGKASFDEAIIPFLNLPAPAINAVWTTFNLTAEGWGLRLDVFAGISKPLAPFLNADDPTMQTYSKKLFDLMDTDMNGIVDALEYICTLAMLSAMEPRDKVRTDDDFIQYIIKLSTRLLLH